MGFLTILTLIMFAAKVFGFIAWSWWIVLLPVMVETFLVLIATTIGLAFIGIFKR